MDTETEPTIDIAETAAPAPPGNPVLLGLITFLPSSITLGLWFVGYLDTATLAGGMIPILVLSSGLFQLVAAIWAAQLGANAVSAVFAVFSAFWLSFGLLLAGLTSGWWAIEAEGVASVQATYLLSFLIVFVLLTLSTLRLPLAFTVGFAFVSATFALAWAAVEFAAPGLFTVAGLTTFAFCGVFGYILVDGLTQDLGGEARPLGPPVIT